MYKVFPSWSKNLCSLTNMYQIARRHYSASVTILLHQRGATISIKDPSYERDHASYDQTLVELISSYRLDLRLCAHEFIAC